MKNKLDKRYFFFIVLIFLLFASLRFYNLDKRIIFDWDQENYSYAIKNVIQKGDFTLIGPRVVNDRGFFLGPYFTYLLLPFYLANNLHPTALIYFIILYNILFFSISLYALNRLFGLSHAIAFLFLWSTNYLLVQYGIIPWNPLLTPLGIIFIWLILYNLYIKNSLGSWILLGLILGFFMNMHFQFIFLIFFSLVFLFSNSKRKTLVTIKNIGILVLSFAIVFIPLVLFDLRHDFLNLKLFFNFFTTNSDNQPYDLNVWQEAFTNFLQPLIYLRSPLALVFFYSLIFFIFIYLYRHKEKFLKYFYFSSLLLWIIVPLFFSFYGKRSSEYYFIFLYPFIMIAIIDFIYSIRQNFLIFPIAILIIAINFRGLKLQLEPNPLGMYYKDKTIKELRESIDPNKKINISFNMPLGANNGYKYLIDWYGIKQSGNWERDSLIEIRIPPRNDDLTVNGIIGLKIPKEVRKK